MGISPAVDLLRCALPILLLLIQREKGSGKLLLEERGSGMHNCHWIHPLLYPPWPSPALPSSNLPLLAPLLVYLHWWMDSSPAMHMPRLRPRCTAGVCWPPVLAVCVCCQWGSPKEMGLLNHMHDYTEGSAILSLIKLTIR